MFQTPHIDRQWVYLEQVSIPPHLLSLGDYPEIVYQTLVRRGFHDLEKAEKFIDFSKYSTNSPYDLPEMDRAISRILHATDRGQKIGVWGDFDVDGQTATAILISALREIRADCTYHIPIRGPETHGIGLNPLKEFINQGVEVILTCDTGSSAYDSIAYAQSNGIDVIVTDHHLLPATLPPAYALINPQRLPATHPLATLAGAGTALKFAEALLIEKGLSNRITQLHDLAAIGCVADVASLTGETRYLVQSGLQSLRSAPRPSIAALLQSAGVDFTRISEEHISFTIAPRLNAVGRLGDANPLVSFLLSEDPVQIAVTVNQLEGLNAQRKFLCDQVFQGAMAQIEQDRTLLEQPILILQHQDWPAGVVGIVASRLVEVFHRPVILLVSSASGALRGSARSVEGIDITAALTLNQAHLLSYGGHPMAAGLSLEAESIEPFKRGMYRTIGDMTKAQVIRSELILDAHIRPSEITLEYARALDVLSPFGPGNPALLFATEGMRVVNSTTVGKMSEHLLLDLENLEGDLTRFIWWNGANLPMPEGWFDLAYTAHATNFRGIEQVQFEWIDYRPSSKEAPVKINKKRQIFKNIDHRNSETPYEELLHLISSQSLTVWQEGTYTPSLIGVNRYSISPCESLAIWSVPPEIKVLQQLLRSALPARVYWFLIPPEEHNIQAFLRTLGKFVKNGLLAQQQHYQLSDLAIHTATTVEIAGLGMEWLASAGHINIVDREQNRYRVLAGGIPDDIERQRLQKSLQGIFEEIHAFYNYLKRTDLDKLSNELA